MNNDNKTQKSGAVSKQDAISYLWSIDSPEEISEMWAILKARSGQLRERNVFNFSVDDEVTFEGRRGQMLKGVVHKVNKKTIIVRVGHEMWRCSPNLIKKVVH